MLSPRYLSAVLLAAFAVAAQAQTPQKIIDEYLRAMGGAKTLSQIRSESIAGNLTDESSGVSGSWSLTVKAPNSFYWEIIAGADRAVEAYNSKSAWVQNTGEGAQTLTGNAAKQAEAAGIYWNGRLADLKKDKFSVQIAGIEKVNGRDTYHIHVLSGTGVAREIFIDMRTHLIAREIAAEGVSFDYDDYRPIAGIPTPFRIELHRSGHDYRVSVTHAEYNAPVDDSIFGFPSAVTTPMPDVVALMREVSKNQEAIEALQKQYTCHLTTENQEVDAKGQIKSITTLEYDVFHIAGQDVQHLLAKDGKPLAGGEKDKEDRRFNKQFAELTKKEADLASDPKKRAEQEKQDAKDQAQISDFLRAERFTNPRRERFRGQSVIAFDFGPNPDFRPKSMMENVVQKLEGVIWIDDQARDVVRVEAHFSSSVKIGGGILASVDKGTNFVFEQTKINDEVWLPSHDETHFSGRLLFLKGNANQINRYSDYKKFHAESKIVGVEN
jgi:hypothetical protein